MDKLEALMVAIDKNRKEVYVIVDIHVIEGHGVPSNCPEDIMTVVNACNKNSDELQFIDMFGFIHDGQVELWEDIDELHK